MINAVIADDEVLARHKLRQLLREETEFEIVGESATAAETIDLVRLTKPDQLLFLDIRMPGMDGFDIIGALSADADFVLPRIIFTTAVRPLRHPRLRDPRGRLSPVKPFTAERLHSAVERFAREARSKPLPRLPRPMAAPTRTGQYLHQTHCLQVPRPHLLFLHVSDIRWIGAEEKYVRISTESESHLLRRNS